MDQCAAVVALEVGVADAVDRLIHTVESQIVIFAEPGVAAEVFIQRSADGGIAGVVTERDTAFHFVFDEFNVVGIAEISAAPQAPVIDEGAEFAHILCTHNMGAQRHGDFHIQFHGFKVVQVLFDFSKFFVIRFIIEFQKALFGVKTVLDQVIIDRLHPGGEVLVVLFAIELTKDVIAGVTHPDAVIAVALDNIKVFVRREGINIKFAVFEGEVQSPGIDLEHSGACISLHLHCGIVHRRRKVGAVAGGFLGKFNVADGQSQRNIDHIAFVIVVAEAVAALGENTFAGKGQDAQTGIVDTRFETGGIKVKPQQRTFTGCHRHGAGKRGHVGGYVPVYRLQLPGTALICFPR